jgi:hypothetical protein
MHTVAVPATAAITATAIVPNRPSGVALIRVRTSIGRGRK